MPKYNKLIVVSLLKHLFTFFDKYYIRDRFCATTLNGPAVLYFFTQKLLKLYNKTISLSNKMNFMGCQDEILYSLNFYIDIRALAIHSRYFKLK